MYPKKDHHKLNERRTLAALATPFVQLLVLQKMYKTSCNIDNLEFY